MKINRDMRQIKADLSSVINKYSIDAALETPDFILAEYIVENLLSIQKLGRALWKWKAVDEKAGE